MDTAVVTGTAMIAHITPRNWNQMMITRSTTIGDSQTAFFITAGTRTFHSMVCNTEYNTRSKTVVLRDMFRATGRDTIRNITGQM